MSEYGSSYRVGEFTVHPALNQIERGSRSIRCEPRVLDLLACLARHAPETVSKKQIRSEVWGSATVSEDAIWRCISELRRAFEDSASAPRYIETIPRRGYRLIAAVEKGAPGTKRFRGRGVWIGVAAVVALLLAATFTLMQPDGREGFSSFEAFTAFSKGRMLTHRGLESDVPAAVEHLGTASELDPENALAHAELSRALVRAGRLRMLSESDPFARARRAADLAMTLDGSLAEAHAAVGSVLFWGERRFDAALAALERALEIDPRDIHTRRDYALLLGALGRHPEAVVEIGRAWQQDTLAVRSSLDAGWIYYFGGRWNDAIEECLFAGDLLPDSVEVRSCLIAGYALGGRPDEASEVVRRLDHLGPISDLDFARLEMREGDRPGALQRLERAASERSVDLTHLGVDPGFHPLRSEPRFLKLLE